MTFICAEAGVNHNGDLGQAFLPCNAAKEAGADAVKFQHFRAYALQPERRALLEPLELADEEMAELAWHCRSIGIEFMCTPFGVPEVEFLTPLVKRWKVASGCLENWPLLAAVRATELPVILSTGMSTIEVMDHRPRIGQHRLALVAVHHAERARKVSLPAVHHSQHFGPRSETFPH